MKIRKTTEREGIYGIRDKVSIREDGLNCYYTENWLYTLPISHPLNSTYREYRYSTDYTREEQNRRTFFFAFGELRDERYNSITTKMEPVSPWPMAMALTQPNLPPNPMSRTNVL
jgi:hypothetical protein